VAVPAAVDTRSMPVARSSQRLGEIRIPPQQVRRSLDDLRVRHSFRHVAHQRYVARFVRIRRMRPIHQQRRNSDRRKDVANINLHDHATKCQESSRGVRLTVRSRPLPYLLVTLWLQPHAGEPVLHAFDDPPLEASVEQLHRLSLVLLPRQRPRVVLSPDVPRLQPHQGERKRTLGERRSKQHAHRRTVANSHQRGTPRTDRVHHRPHVVHPLLKRRRAHNTIRRPRTPLIELNQPGKRRQLHNEIPELRLIRLALVNAPHERRHEHQVEGALTLNPIRDVNIATLRITRLWNVHSPSLSRQALPRRRSSQRSRAS
jgi:hypothetical protein